MMEGEPPPFVLVIWAIIAAVILVGVCRHYIGRMLERRQGPKPEPVECEEEEATSALPPPPRVPRIFNMGETFSVARYPLPKMPRNDGSVIRFQLGDRFVRGPSRTWSINGILTDISDAEMAAFLRTGDVIREGFEPLREDPLLVGTSPLLIGTSGASRTAALDLGPPRDPYASAPVVRLLKDEPKVPRASRYERILDEDEESAPQVNSEPRDP